MRESASTSRQLTNYTHNSDYEEYTGMYAHNSDHGGMFMMKHRENSMSASTSNSALKPEDVWFVDSGASNHMTSHKEWFLELREPERPGYVETGDDATVRNGFTSSFGHKPNRGWMHEINVENERQYWDTGYNVKNPQWWEKPRQPTGFKIHYMWEEYKVKENREATTSCLLLHHTQAAVTGWRQRPLSLSLSLSLLHALYN